MRVVSVKKDPALLKLGLYQGLPFYNAKMSILRNRATFAAAKSSQSNEVIEGALRQSPSPVLSKE
jgi:hypothetical protein